MNKTHNSSALAKKIAEKLNLNRAQSLELYKELSQIPNGPAKDVLEFLAEYHPSGTVDFAKYYPTSSQKQKNNTMQKYAACIKGDCVRDAKYSKFYDMQPDDDGWIKAYERPLFLEIVEADTQPRAIQIAASHAGVDTSVIELYPMD